MFSRAGKSDKQFLYQQSVLSLMQLKADSYSNRGALELRGDGRWNTLTYAELASRVTHLSDYLIQQGFKPGDRIAIHSESRPEWAVALFASVRCGAVTVPLDTRLTAGELISILSDSAPAILFVSEQLSAIVDEIRAQLPSLKEVYLLNPAGDDSRFRSIDQLRGEPQDGISRQPDETALIVYTS